MVTILQSSLMLKLWYVRLQHRPMRCETLFRCASRHWNLLDFIPTQLSEHHIGWGLPQLLIQLKPNPRITLPVVILSPLRVTFNISEPWGGKANGSHLGSTSVMY